MNRYRPRLLTAATVLTGLALMPVLAYGAGNLWMQTHTAGTHGGWALQRMVGLPVAVPLAKEFDSQVAVLQRSLGQQSFYVVDSSDGALWSLTVLLGIASPQHHVVMLRGLLNPAIAEAVKTEMRSYEFVVVNHDEYRRVLDGRGNGDAWLDAIYRHVRDNFTPIARYDAPVNRPRQLDDILSFDVLRRMERPPDIAHTGLDLTPWLLPIFVDECSHAGYGQRGTLRAARALELIGRGPGVSLPHAFNGTSRDVP